MINFPPKNLQFYLRIFTVINLNEIQIPMKFYVNEQYFKKKIYICIYTIFPKVLAPPSNERFNYLSNFHEYKS